MNWSLLQNSIGIDIQGDNFTAVCVKRQWKQIRVMDRLEIPHYRAAGPQECGRIYAEFLRANGLKMPRTVVALPRSRVLLRCLNFPRAVAADLPQAIQFQLDSLHPFEEGSVYYDFSWKPPRREVPGGSNAPERIEVPVAITEKKYVDDTASWFEEAGIAVSQFTVSTAALLAAIGDRLGLQPSPQSRSNSDFVVLDVGADATQIIGYAEGSILSKELSTSTADSDAAITAIRRDLELARSELRLDPETVVPLVVCGRSQRLASEAAEGMRFEISSAESLFPYVDAGKENFWAQDSTVAFAAALAGVDGTLPYSLNLLPRERRSYRSPMVYFPAYALGGLILVLGLALGARGSYQDWRYQQFIEQQIQSLQPQVKAVDSAEQQSRKTYEHLALLAGLKNTSLLPLEILDELTKQLPPDAWLQQVQYDENTVMLAGYVKSAAPLLQTLAASNLFESPQFLSAISKTPDGMEAFRIGVRLRKAK